jgi:hypothetical protein
MKHVARRSSIRVVAAPLLACLLGLAAFAAASDGSASSVPWDASTPLTWDLFRCAPPADAVHRSEAAAIHMTIHWHASYSVTSNGSGWTGHVTSVAVTNTMEPSLSWVVPGKGDGRILRHEQAHFDLNEVYRRKLEVLLPRLRAQSASKQGAIDGLDAALHRQANEVLEQLQAVQARYDAESEHGNNPAGQSRWEARIAAWLRNPAAAP